MDNNNEQNITVYMTTWCSDSIRTMRLLDTAGIPYTAIDIDKDAEAEELVRRLNNGMRSVPTLNINGQILTEPSNRQLREILDLN